MQKYRAGWLIDGSGRPPEKNMLLTVEKGRIRSLDHGIVAIRDGGDCHGHAFAYKTGHLNPRVNPIKVFTAGRAWRRAGRYGTLVGRDTGSGNSLVSAIKSSTGKLDHVKIVNSGLNSLVQFGKETLPQFSLEEMTAAVTTVKKMGLKTIEN